MKWECIKNREGPREGDNREAYAGGSWGLAGVWRDWAAGRDHHWAIVEGIVGGIVGGRDGDGGDYDYSDGGDGMKKQSLRFWS